MYYNINYKKNIVIIEMDLNKISDTALSLKQNGVRCKYLVKDIEELSSLIDEMKSSRVVGSIKSLIEPPTPIVVISANDGVEVMMILFLPGYDYFSLIYTTRYKKRPDKRVFQRIFYQRVSRWSVILPQRGQNFFNSRRSGVLRRFLVVM